jgi:hypothetical protein
MAKNQEKSAGHENRKNQPNTEPGKTGNKLPQRYQDAK